MYVSGKSQSRSVLYIRTANRHRCVGRVDQGVSSNGGLRNSAKNLSVSYARSSALFREGFNKRLSTDCLAKTQVPANPKGHV